MKKILLPMLVMATALLTGCFEMEDTLTLRKDGSGDWKFRIVLGPQMVAMMAAGDGKKNEAILTETVFRQEMGKIKGAKVIGYQRQMEAGKLAVSAEITFASIAEMYRNGAFAEQFNWAFRRVDGRLEARIHKGLMAADSNDSSMQVKFESIKPMLLGMKMDRTLVLPNEVVSGNAGESTANRARWFFEVTAATTEAEFKGLTATSPLAVCALDGVSFELPAGPAGTQPPDLSEFLTTDATLKALLAQVSIEPVRAGLRRNVKYDAADNMTYGSAPLTLAVRLKWPTAMRPSGWSHLTVESAADDTGRDLTPKPDRHADRVTDLRPDHRGENVAELSVGLGEPARAAKSYRVRGAVVLHVPAKITPVKVPGVTELVGQPLTAAGLAAFGLRVKSFNGSRLELVGDRPNDAVIEIKLFSADLATELKNFQVNRFHFRDEYRITANFASGREKLENPTVVIVVAGEVGKYAVPFEFNDLAMP